MIDISHWYQRRYYRAMLMITLLLSTLSAAALEVGEISIHSKLGEPLNATIPLKHYEEFKGDQLKIRLASQAMYKKLGLSTPALYQQIKADIKQPGVVTLSTRYPIKEPYVSILLQFLWPEGDFYREFTLLIDPAL